MGLAAELLIASNMVPMAMGVRDDKLNALLILCRQPLGNNALHGVPDGEARRGVGGTGVLEEDLLPSEEQIEKRCLVMNALVLSQNIGVFVVAMNLDRRIGIRLAIL